MNRSAAWILVVFFFILVTVRAEQRPSVDVDIEAPGVSDNRVPIDIFETQSAYVFESDLNHGGSFGKQDEIANHIYYAHRFQITGNWYARTGLAYDRYDFTNTSAPIPVHLQSGAAVFSIDYMH